METVISKASFKIEGKGTIEESKKEGISLDTF